MEELDLHVTSLTLIALILGLCLAADNMLASFPTYDQWRHFLLLLMLFPQGRLLTAGRDRLQASQARGLRYFLINEAQVLVATLLLLIAL